jgi:LPS-assembly protein
MQGDSKSGNWFVPGDVELSDPNLVVRGKGAQAATAAGTVDIEATSFELPARFGHGSASHIQLNRDGEVNLRDVRYTTCPGPKPDWEVKAGELHIDGDARSGTARNMQLFFKGVEIFPVPFAPVPFPYFSFPVGNERKTGLLAPNFGHSSRTGYSLSLPVYWNIAPNYDATITPTWYGERGLDLGTKFRFLTNNSRGDIGVNYLPNDHSTGEDRSFVELHDQTDFTSQLRLTADGSSVSDNQWLEDFGNGIQRTGVSVLPRAARLIYRGNEWSLGALVQNYQVVDTEITGAEEPFTLLPQIAFRGWFPDRRFGLGWGGEAEYSNFRSANDSTSDGQRFDITPEVRLPLRHGGMYIEPTAAWRFTAYQLELADPNADRNPTRSAPILSLDSGMVFERASGNAGKRVQTFEPRLLYLYVPFREQGNLPVFDTKQPDFNLIQLFSTNRYVGPDRLGDANQIAMGFTTRLLDAGNGKQYLSATLGEIYRFATPRVLLPDEIATTTSNSDLIGELKLGEYKNWNAGIGLQWDPSEQVLQRTEVSVQYIPGAGRVINAAYVYRKAAIAQTTQTAPSDLKQIDTSIAWPFGTRVNLFARYVYSLEDQKAVDSLVGLEYRDCCWGFRFGMHQSRNQQGELENAWQWQVELNGLADVGSASDAFLSQAIRGYSAARFDRRSVP